MRGIIRAPEKAPVTSVNGEVGDVTVSQLVSAPYRVTAAGYENFVGVALSIGGETKNYLYVADDKISLYDGQNGQYIGTVYATNAPPWGGEQMAYIQPSQMEGFTVSEQANTIYMVRCGFCSLSISGIAAPAGATLYITGLPPAKHRVEVAVVDIGRESRSVGLAYIDGGNTVIGITPPVNDIVAGYFSMVYPIQ